MCVFVCLSVCEEDISRATCTIFTKFVDVAYGSGSVILRRHCDTLCTSSFVNDIMMFFSTMDCIVVCTSLQRTDFT